MTGRQRSGEQCTGDVRCRVRGHLERHQTNRGVHWTHRAGKKGGKR